MRPLGAATYGFLFERSLIDTLTCLGEMGIERVELTIAPPQVDGCTLDVAEQRRIMQCVRRFGMRLVSLNPTYIDINLCSLNSGFRRESLHQLTRALHLCHDLGVEMLVLFAGRRHVLAPAPMKLVEPLLLDGLNSLLTDAESLGVALGLENGPTLVVERGEELARVCALFDGRVRAVFDVANAHLVEEVADGLFPVLPYLGLVHLSDTTRLRWQHAAVGEGDVDFSAVAGVLNSARYSGPSIMEVVDIDQPLAALEKSVAGLAPLGWTLH
jgi:L-ribulose-5-phosphate 3-epimerase